MEKSQYNLCIKVIERLHQAGILQDTLVIGSWCLLFYEEYFSGVGYHPTIRTRDIDFLVPQPRKIHAASDVPALLKDLGFIRDIGGDAGYIRLLSPDLIVEFLVPEKGRGSDKPLPLPEFMLNAQPLRFLDFLSKESITATVMGIPVRLPHPIHFALHKLIVASRRPKPEKEEKDRRESLQVLAALSQKGQLPGIKKVFKNLPPKWRKTILQELKIGKAEALTKELERD